MKTFATRSFARFSDGFTSFSLAQKVIAVVGSLAVLVAALMLVRWVATPEYATLFSNLEPEDANAIVEELESSGTPYELAGDGTSVRVPRDDVYRTRIAMSGEGLPTAADGGYSLLDEQDLSTSQFQERTDFKRAMEGELAATIQAMDGVDSAIVHLALPEKEVFSDEQAPPTASVLLGTPRGETLDAEQVQSVVHLVAASVDDMDPEQVTVADSSGRLLSADDGSGMGAFATSRDQYVRSLEQQYRQRVQSMLDQVVGPGNSTVQVSADVNFDRSTVESRSYTQPEGQPALSSSTDTETYDGTAPAGTSGVVGPDGQMDTTGTAGGDGSSYEKTSRTSDNAVNTSVEQRETAPGSLTGLHVAAVVEQTAAAQNQPRELQRMISSAIGIDQQRGDTFRLSVLPFDTSAQDEAAAALEAQEAEAAAATRMDMFRNVAIGAGLLLALLLAWLLRRRRDKQRVAATNYVVEQLQTDARRRDELPAATALSLEGTSSSPEQETREELIALVENQPEDVAALLRGWLVDKR